jgi:hypothetical protein
VSYAVAVGVVDAEAVVACECIFYDFAHDETVGCECSEACPGVVGEGGGGSWLVRGWGGSVRVAVKER